jgi:quercetin dioxygenase-like cupin family protein
MQRLTTTALWLFLLASAAAKAQTITIMRSGSQPSRKATAEYFTGAVRIDPLFQAKDSSRASGSSVTFEPGARSAWHTHPLGQTLIVTAGLGWVQQEGHEKQESKREMSSGYRRV